MTNREYQPPPINAFPSMVTKLAKSIQENPDMLGFYRQLTADIIRTTLRKHGNCGLPDDEIMRQRERILNQEDPRIVACSFITARDMFHEMNGANAQQQQGGNNTETVVWQSRQS